MIKKSEMHELSVSLNRPRISHLLGCHQGELSIESKTTTKYTRDLADLDEAVKMTQKEEVNVFSSKTMHA